VQKNKEGTQKEDKEKNVIFPFCSSIEVQTRIQIYGNFSHDRLYLQNKSISLGLRSSSYRKRRRRRRRRGFIPPFLTAEIYITTLLFPILTWLPSHSLQLLFLLGLLFSDIRRYNLHFLFRVFLFISYIPCVFFALTSLYG